MNIKYEVARTRARTHTQRHVHWEVFRLRQLALSLRSRRCGNHTWHFWKTIVFVSHFIRTALSNEVRYVYISPWIFHPIRQKYTHSQNPSTASSFGILCHSFRYVSVYMCTVCIAYFGSISRRTKICMLKKSRAESPHHVNIASASYWGK